MSVLSITTRRTGALVAASCAAAAVAFTAALPLGFTVPSAQFKPWTLGTPWAAVYDLAFGFLVVAAIVRMRGSTEPDKSHLKRRAVISGILGGSLFLAADSGTDALQIAFRTHEAATSMYFVTLPMAILSAVYIVESRAHVSWSRFAIATGFAAFGSLIGCQGVLGIAQIALLATIKSGPAPIAMVRLPLGYWGWGVAGCVLAGVVAYCIGAVDKMFRPPWFAVSDGGARRPDVELEDSLTLFGEPASHKAGYGPSGIRIVQGGPDYFVQNGPGYEATVNGMTFHRHKLVGGDVVCCDNHVAVYCLPIDFLAGWPIRK